MEGFLRPSREIAVLVAQSLKIHVLESCVNGHCVLMEQFQRQSPEPVVQVVQTKRRDRPLVEILFVGGLCVKMEQFQKPNPEIAAQVAPRNEHLEIRTYHKENDTQNCRNFASEERGRVSSNDNKRIYSRQTRLQREHIFMNFNWPTRE